MGNNIKKAYFITGIGCSGKTSIANRISELGQYPVVHTDDAFNLVIQKLGVDETYRRKINDIETWIDPKHIGKESYAPYENFEQCVREAYSELFSKKEDTVVVEGEAPALRPKEWEMMMDNLEGYSVRIIFLNPSYEQWLKNRSARHYQVLAEPRGFLPPYASQEDYDRKQYAFREKLPKSFFEINDYEQLNLHMTVPEYQFAEFSDPKWKQFQFPEDMTGKTFLDIGCNAGWFMEKAQKQGAKVYGIDIDWHLLDIALDRVPEAEVALKKIEEFEAGMQFDYILCSSAFHFFTDHDNVLAKIAELTKGYFILEVPVMEKDYEEMIHGEDMRSAVPSRPLLMKWLNNNFSHVEEISTTDQWQPNETNKKIRHVFKCHNN